MDYDVVIIGAGPAGLAAAIKLKELAGKELQIAVLEKGSSIGAHNISGSVIDPKSLDELIPNWRELDYFPNKCKVTSEEIRLLCKKSSIKLPTPKKYSNHGNYIISLSQLCIALATYAETLGIEIYPGFAVTDTIISNNVLTGITVGYDDETNLDLPSNKITVNAKQFIIAEGCRGSISKKLIKHFNLDQGKAIQTYGLGIKEVWQVGSSFYKPGKVSHYLGYPLNNKAYGGGFVYHLNDNLVSVGLVTALDYSNYNLSPYDEFQQFKMHKEILQLLKNGTRIEYGARTISEGGFSSIPKTTFNGGLLIGEAAGLVNVPKAKGVHYAIKSGILAAHAVLKTISEKNNEAYIFHKLLNDSYIYKDLYSVRNFRHAFKIGFYPGLIYNAIEYYLLGNKTFWSFRAKQHDRQQLKKNSKPINYPAYDNEITFAKTGSIFYANLNAAENQRCHLHIHDQNKSKQGIIDYDAPETKYCPAGVYVLNSSHDKVQINATNCIHCKACDIKDPQNNITWTPPEGGSGPQYSHM